MNKKTTLELLDFILESIEVIKKRMQGIESDDDFLSNDDNLTKLDSILMRLQAMGEAIKNLDKRERNFLLLVADEAYWSDIIRFRDFISHHYTDILANDVYDVCTKELDILKKYTIQLKESL